MATFLFDVYLLFFFPLDLILSWGGSLILYSLMFCTSLLHYSRGPEQILFSLLSLSVGRVLGFGLRRALQFCSLKKITWILFCLLTIFLSYLSLPVSVYFFLYFHISLSRPSCTPGPAWTTPAKHASLSARKIFFFLSLFDSNSAAMGRLASGALHCTPDKEHHIATHEKKVQPSRRSTRWSPITRKRHACHLHHHTQGTAHSAPNSLPPAYPHNSSPPPRLHSIYPRREETTNFLSISPSYFYSYKTCFTSIHFISLCFYYLYFFSLCVFIISTLCM
ncbi:hypothetical protein EDC01DRAFT_118330 [Geopyxis carbonaria]|nr:hypothetical protein EDC01DRAFT_118330 [Geopyxis carbonaria]